MNHQELVEQISYELYLDNAVSALLLYGSVSRKEETANSDIDFLVIINESYLQKRHAIRDGITVEFVEMDIKFLQNFIEKKEIPMLFALSDGILLFDKTAETEHLIIEAKNALENGPTKNPRWQNDEYKVFKRSELTELYKDMLDVEDKVLFHYITSLFITSTIPLLIENYNLWPRTRKKTMDYLKLQCAEGYNYIETLLRPECSLPQKRQAAKGLIEYTMIQHGGILEGEAVIFRKDSM